MSQTVHTYLQQRRNEPEQDCGDEESDFALTQLPDDIPVYRYQSLPQLAAIAYTVDNESGYCVFLGVPESDISEKREAINFKSITFYPRYNVLIGKMPRRYHEAAINWLHGELVVKVEQMGMRFILQLKSVGASLIVNREPDYCLRPKSLPHGRPMTWPSLVVATESQEILRDDPYWWTRQSNHDVKVVITITVSKTKITIKRWDEQALLKEDIAVERYRQQSVIVVGHPLRIPFQDLFLRDPIGYQGDLLFGEYDLKEWAESIWQEF
ncbi:hypothetical protein LOZ66_000436 [Ophidiomyces ophidiicola]|nr:hypothetical protein LOZ65_005180 [Ophidiomyces ophidiicola]KAI1943849.1 hypothetical protein LOZ66_000436 [Ophidiomyces ophidiicola]